MTIRVLAWATTLGADLWSFARQLEACDDVELKIVMDRPDLFRREGVSALFPLRSELIARRKHHHILGLPGWKADVTIFDNKMPLRPSTRAGMALWHGFGWKDITGEAEIAPRHAAIERAWGSAKVANPHFRWPCFGPWDLEYRSARLGYHEDNCRLVGAASHDDLRVPLDRARARPFYPFDVARRRTVLIAPTWHYGEVFAHWGADAELFERLLAHCARRDADVILRLHDSHRFDRRYRRFLRDLQRRHPHVLLKFKDRAPDNYLDLQVADVLVTNFSSIANLFYATGRPTVHVYPVSSADEAFMLRSTSALGLREKRVEAARFIWKLPPEENGGLLARDFDQLLAQLDQALDEPACCAAPARRFLDEYMMGADGQACARALATLREIA